MLYTYSSVSFNIFPTHHRVIYILLFINNHILCQIYSKYFINIKPLNLYNNQSYKGNTVGPILQMGETEQNNQDSNSGCLWKHFCSYHYTVLVMVSFLCSISLKYRLKVEDYVLRLISKLALAVRFTFMFYLHSFLRHFHKKHKLT